MQGIVRFCLKCLALVHAWSTTQSMCPPDVCTWPQYLAAGDQPAYENAACGFRFPSCKCHPRVLSFHPAVRLERRHDKSYRPAVSHQLQHARAPASEYPAALGAVSMQQTSSTADELSRLAQQIQDDKLFGQRVRNRLQSFNQGSRGSSQCGASLEAQVVAMCGPTSDESIVDKRRLLR